MNKSSFLKLLNSNTFSLEVFREAAKILGKELSSELEDFIKLGIKNLMYSNYILDRYEYCLLLLIKHFQVNSIKNLQTNQVIKYY